MSEVTGLERVFNAMPLGAWIVTNDVADVTGISRSTVSSATTTLRKRGLITSRRLPKSSQYEHKRIRKMYVGSDAPKGQRPRRRRVVKGRTEGVAAMPDMNLIDMVKSLQAEVVALRVFAQDVQVAVEKLNAAR